MSTTTTTGPTTTSGVKPSAIAPKSKRKNSWRRWLTPLIVLLVVAAAIVFGWQRIQGARAAATTSIDTRPASVGNLVASINAAGNLAPASQVNLNFTSSGVVKDVLVKEGDKVKAGQPLARLTADDLALQVSAAESSLKSAQLKLEQAKQGPKDTDITSAQAKVDSAQAALNKLRQGPTAADMADVQARLTSAQANLAKVQAGPTDQDVATARQKVENAKNALWANQASRDATCGRPKGGDTDPQCQQARAQVNSSEGNVAIAQNDLDKLLAGPNENDIITARQQVAQAQAAIDKLRQGPTAADITQAQSSITQAEAGLEAVKAGPDDLSIQVAQTAIDQAQVNLKQAQLKLQQATLTAPFDGVITAVSLVPGQTMGASGNPIQLSDLGTLQVVTNVSELDRARLKVGQEVQMTLEALPGVNVQGIVDAISTAGVTTQGVVNFPVTIKLVKPDPAVAPGMTANLNVIIDKRDNVLLVPNRAIRNNGRQRTVTVMVEGQQITVPVQTGMTDGTNTEITGGGLKEGDQVVLTATTGARAGGFGAPPGGGVLLGGPGPGR